MFAAVIFDMDGLLLDSERNIMRAWLDAARECGFSLSQEQFMPLIGHGSRRSNAMLIDYLGGEKEFQQVRDLARSKLQAMGSDAYPLKPGAMELLTALADRGIPCAVASSTSLAEVKRRLEMVGVLHFFASVVGGDSVAESKPSPDVYLMAADKLGMQPHECLAFEDSANGLAAAIAAGIAVVLIPDMSTPICDKVFAVLPSLASVLPNLSEWLSVSVLPDTGQR